MKFGKGLWELVGRVIRANFADNDGRKTGGGGAEEEKKLP